MRYYSYTDEQKKVLMQETKHFYKRLKNSGLFEEGVPPIVVKYSWGFSNVLSQKKLEKSIDTKIEEFLNGTTWDTL